jgi:asparagine synthase (glutamine-hydrolysing)
MCGIVGLWTPGANTERLRCDATAMADRLVHRGPDDAGIWVEPKRGLALGHRRLKILDLSATGAQPMVSASGRHIICYNGEIYNFMALRSRLEAEGHTFKGASDTEVALTSIEAWGLEAALNRFVGMFAFALWDTRDKVLVLVRDRMGIKPLYWGCVGGGLIFASELVAFKAVRGFDANIDRNALAGYMRWNYVPSPHSIYQGVNKLAPGTLVRIAHEQPPSVETWWNSRSIVECGLAVRGSLDKQEALADLEAAIGKAVRDRMVADVPLGALLSGGVDSSAVVALMQAASDRPVRTFTIGFEEKRFDEASHARQIAAHLGTDHTELEIGTADALALATKVARYYDEPFADSSQIPTSLVSALARQHVTVALSGDGGDELFAGYTRYNHAEAVWRHTAKWPGAARQALALGVGGIRQLLTSPGSRAGVRAARLASWLTAADPDDLYRLSHTHWPEPEALVVDGREPRGAAWSVDLEATVPDFVERMQLLDTLTYLHDDILTKVDRASMAVSLEVRVPLVDHRIFEAVWRLPSIFKRRGDAAKWILRGILSRHVPEALIDRPKKGFSVPTADWLRGPLREWAADLMAPETLHRQGYLQTVPVATAWRQLLAGRDELAEPIWGVIMFQSWLAEQEASR